MKYEPIDRNLFIRNRKRFAEKLLSNSVAIFFSNDIFSRNADDTYPFKQNSNLFYLTGIDQEDTILVLYPDCRRNEFKELLFIRKSNETLEIWEGHKLTQEEAKNISGIENVHFTENFDSLFHMIVKWSEHCYLDYNEHARVSARTLTRSHFFAEELKRLYPAHDFKRSAPILHRLRAVKSETELKLLQQSIDITEKAFRRILKEVKPGVWEYEIEASITDEFLRNRATGHAYTPIVAAGKNACVLHYIVNNSQCRNGELLLMDFGAEYANYCADLTRCVPVNGKFSKRQKQVYNSVHHVMNEAVKMLVPGNTLDEYHKKVGEIMTEQLLKLKLLKKDEVKKHPADGGTKQPAYKKYFMHGTSHYLGLDTHDVGDLFEPMKEGMVFTCEPGIYIKKERLGIRLENDILVTKKGPVDLMKNIPVEAGEIEEIMHTKK